MRNKKLPEFALLLEQFFTEYMPLSSGLSPSRPPLSQNSHPLCDLDIDFEHIDSLLAKDAKDFALGIF